MQHFVATSNYLIFSSTDNHCFCMYLQTQKTIQNNSHFVGPEACTTSLSFLNNYLLLFEKAKRSTILVLDIRRYCNSTATLDIFHHSRTKKDKNEQLI